MSEISLPEGWLKTKLGETIELKYGKSLPAKKRDGGEFPVFGSNGIVGQHSAPLVEDIGLIVGRKGSYGEVHFSNSPFFPIDTTYFVDEFYGQPIKYWYYQLKYLPLTTLNRSTAIPGLNREDAYNQDIFLPPLAEQKQIATTLDKLLAQVDTLKTRLDAIPNILKRFRQSVLSAAVSGKLTKGWREDREAQNLQILAEIESYWEAQYKKQNKKYRRPKIPLSEIMLTELPASWLSTQVGYVFDVYVGATPSRKNASYWDGDINWVSSSEVSFCKINETKEKVTLDGLESASTMLHPIGTVMLAMIGQGKTRGQSAILDVAACHNQNTAALRVPSDYAVSEFLYFVLVKQYEETRKVGSGNNQKALNKATVQSLPFPLPPLKEQTEIICRIEELFAFADQIEQRAKDAQQRVNNLTQSILAKAFRGELTEQWRKENLGLISGENSAEALLAKIKAEREVLEKEKKAKRKTTRRKAVVA